MSASRCHSKFPWCCDAAVSLWRRTASWMESTGCLEFPPTFRNWGTQCKFPSVSQLFDLHFVVTLFFFFPPSNLRGEFESDGSPDLNKDLFLQDIHCVSSLCKAYFRELPNPLLTYQLYDKFAVSSSCMSLNPPPHTTAAVFKGCSVNLQN